MHEKVSCHWLSGAAVKHYDRCHVYVASVTDWLSLVLSPPPYLLYSSLLPLHISTHPFFSHSHFSFLHLPPCSLTASPSIPGCVFVAEWRPLHDDTAGRDAAWYRCGDEVPVRHELCSPRPRRPEYPGQQQLGLQGLWLWPVTLSGRHFRWPDLHKLPGQYRVCACVCANSTVFVDTACLIELANFIPFSCFTCAYGCMCDCSCVPIFASVKFALASACVLL